MMTSQRQTRESLGQTAFNNTDFKVNKNGAWLTSRATTWTPQLSCWENGTVVFFSLKLGQWYLLLQRVVWRMNEMKLQKLLARHQTIRAMFVYTIIFVSVAAVTWLCLRNHLHRLWGGKLPQLRGKWVPELWVLPRDHRACSLPCYRRKSGIFSLNPELHNSTTVYWAGPWR